MHFEGEFGEFGRYVIGDRHCTFGFGAHDCAWRQRMRSDLGGVLKDCGAWSIRVGFVGEYLEGEARDQDLVVVLDLDVFVCLEGVHIDAGILRSGIVGK